MLRLSVFLSLVFAFSSCMTIGYEVSQPAGKKSLKEFPEAFLGVYDDEPLGRDTELVILSHSVFLDGDDELNQGELFLSDSLVLKKFRGFYIVSYWDKEMGTWMIYPFKSNGGQLQVYNLDVKKESAASQLSAFTPIVRQEPDLLVINPSRKELKKMLSDPELWEVQILYRRQ